MSIDRGANKGDVVHIYGGAFGSPLGCCLSEDLFVTGWWFGDQGGGRTCTRHHFLWPSGWLLATGYGT